MIGDSISKGYGDVPTGDGSDGLAYGGATLPAAVTLREASGDAVAWPDNGGLGSDSGGADPGYLPHIADVFLGLGFSAVELYRWGGNGATSAVVRDTHYLNAWVDSNTQGWVPHVVLIAVGTNDGTDSATYALFDQRLDDLYGQIDARWPNARVGHIHPVGDNSGARPELDNVRTSISAKVAEKATRFELDRSGLNLTIGSGDLADDVHPSLSGYRNQIRNKLSAAWGGTS